MTSPSDPQPPTLPRPWTAHYEQDVPHDFTPTAHTLPQLLLQTAGKFPRHTAMTFIGGKTTYQGLLDQALKLASALQKMGVKKGDRVAVMLPNCPQFIVSFFGTLLAGGVVVNTSPLYTAHELEHQLVDSGSETLIIMDMFYTRYLEIQ